MTKTKSRGTANVALSLCSSVEEITPAEYDSSGRSVMSKLDRFLKWVDIANDFVGRWISLLVLPLIVVILYEVLMRYVLHQSQDWVPETSQFLFSALFGLGGGYILLNGGHVKLDLLYDRLSPRLKAALDVATFIFFLIYCGVLFWKGALMGWDSLKIMERSQSSWGPILFPFKFIIPIGTGLLILQGVVKFIRDISILTKRNGHGR
jgi:TRAP-type mannitol/chloroaromatic compound transport system permease small subunit